MYKKELQEKVTTLVHQKTKGINGNEITAKDFNAIQKAFSASVGEVFGTEKAPRIKDFGLNPSTSTVTGTFQFPVTLEVSLNSNQESTVDTGTSSTSEESQ